MAQIDSVGQGLRVLRRRAGLIVFLLVLGCAASLGHALRSERVYEAVASVQIETPQISGVQDGGTGNPIETRLRLIEQKLMARETLLDLIAAHGLFADQTEMSDALRVTLLREAVRIDRLMDSSQSWRSDLQPTGLAITVRLGEAQQATDLANAFLDLVLREGRDRATRRADSTLLFFETEEARVRSEIALVESQIATLKSTQAGSLPEAASARTAQLATLRDAQLALEQQIIGFETGRDRLRDEEARRQGALLDQQAQLIAGRIAEVQALIAAAPEAERQLNMLERNRTRLQEEYTAVTTRRADAAMSQVLETNEQNERFEVLDRALVPESPVSTGRRKLAMTGVLMSVLVAFGAALGLEWISPRLRTSAQIERALGLRPVVVIPDLRVPRGRRLS